MISSRRSPRPIVVAGQRERRRRYLWHYGRVYFAQCGVSGETHTLVWPDNVVLRLLVIRLCFYPFVSSLVRPTKIEMFFPSIPVPSERHSRGIKVIFNPEFVFSRFRPRLNFNLRPFRPPSHLGILSERHRASTCS